MSKQKIAETEDQLISTARDAVSQCNWVVGECASKWTKKYAKGRTDTDFGTLVGMSGDQVYQRRRVWESFADVHTKYSSLKWSHFYVSLNWDDAPECLQWAEENQSTVAEMRAWRRALRGEDLNTEPEIDDSWMDGADPELINVNEGDLTVVRDPADFGGSGSPVTAGAASPREAPETVAAVARESDGFDPNYSPFRKGAGAPAPKEQGGDVAVVEKPAPSPELVLKRVVTTLERANKLLTPEVIGQAGKLPEKVRNRLVESLADLNSKIASAGL